MADETLLNGIVNVDVFGVEEAQADLTRFVQIVSEQFQRLSGMSAGTVLGTDFMRDLERGKASVEQLGTALRTLRAQPIFADAGAQTLARDVDLLISRFEQLGRVQAAAASGNPVRVAETRAQILAENERVQRELAAEQQRAAAQQRRDRVPGVGPQPESASTYGDGLAGAKRLDQIRAAEDKIETATSRVARARERLATLEERRDALAQLRAQAERQVSLAESRGRRVDPRVQQGLEDVRGQEAEAEAAIAREQERIAKGNSRIAELTERLALVRQDALNKAEAERKPGASVDYDALIAEARARVTATGDDLLKAQLDDRAAQQRLDRALERNDRSEFKTQEEADRVLSQATSQREAAGKRLSTALEKHAAAEERAAALVSEQADVQRTAGSPQRRLLLEEDSGKFLAGAGVDVSQSAKQQELLAQQQQLVASRAKILDASKAEGLLQADVTKLTDQRIAIERRIIANQQAIARQQFVEGGRGGFFGGLFGNFSGSPEGISGADIGFQAGQALKFYALYTGLSMVQRSIEALITLSAEYSRTVADLAIALQTSNDEAAGAAETYAEVGASMATGPNEAVAAAAKFVRTFTDEVGNPSQQSGLFGAQVGSKINVLEGPDRIEPVMQDLIAVLKGFNMGAEGANPTYDTATAIARAYGFNGAGDILTGTAAISDIGRESGYSLSQLLELVAGVSQRTGTTSDAAAGDIKRILGGADTPELNTIFAARGIKLDQSFRDKIEQLYDSLEAVSPETRSRIVTNLGDNRTGAAAAALLENVAKARQVEANVVPGAAGYADRLVEQKLDTMGGALQKLAAQAQELAVSVGDLGLADLLGLIAEAFSGVASAADDLAKIINVIPDPLKEVVLALVAMHVAAKALAASRAAFAGSPLMGALTGGGAAAGGGTSAAAAAATAAATDGAIRTADGRIRGANGRFLAASSAQAQALVQQEQAMVAATTTTGRFTGGLRTFTGAAGAALRALGPIALALGALTLYGDVSENRDRRRTATELGDDALKQVQQGIESGDIEQLKTASAALLDSSRELRSTSDGIAGFFTDKFQVPDSPQTTPDMSLWDQILAGFQGTNPAGAGLRLNTTPYQQDMVEQLRVQRDARQQAEYAILLAESEARVSAASTEKTPFSQLFGASGDLTTTAIKTIKDKGFSASSSINYFEQAAQQLDLAKLFPAGEQDKGATEFFRVIVDRINRLTNPLEKQEGFSQLQQAVQQLQTRVAPGSVEADVTAQLLEQANRLYLDSMIDNLKSRIENIKAVQGENSKSKAAITTLVEQALSAAAEAGDVGSIVQILSMVDKQFLDTFMSNIRKMRTALANQLKALKAAAQAASIATAMQREIRSGELDGELNAQDARAESANRAQQAEIQKQIQAYDRQLKALEEGGKLANFSNSAFEFKDSKKADGPTAEEIEMARIAAQAVPGDQYSQAVTSLKLARYQLAHAKDKKEYWDALKSLREAQYELGQVELDRANNARLLSIDITDPVAQARNAVKQAQDRLRFDQNRGASSATLTADRAQLRQAQASAASTAWSQQFSDWQTNYELQRVSLSAYLNYLNTQRAYLSAVKNKTRDQVEQLNQVDRALKGLADGLQGQWNLGEIRVPTPYEIRRAMAASGGAGGNTTTNYIQIDGANMVAVTELLTRLLGVSTIQAASTTPAKV